MASIAAALGSIKAELGSVLSREHVTTVCEAVGGRWRHRVLDPRSPPRTSSSFRYCTATQQWRICRTFGHPAAPPRP